MKPILPTNTLAEKCPSVLDLWDHEKNGVLCPENVSVHAKNKVWWRCERGHSWQSPVNGVASNGTRCPYCAGLRAIPGQTDLVTLFPKIAAEWDYEKNGELDPGNTAPGTHTKVWWKCSLGHSWQSAPYSRTREFSAGCPYCTGRRVFPGFNDLATLKPQLASEWDQTLNGELTPSDVTLGSNKKVWWRCSDGHVWQACVYSRTKFKGTGCPVCAGVMKRRRIKYYMDDDILIRNS